MAWWKKKKMPEVLGLLDFAESVCVFIFFMSQQFLKWSVFMLWCADASNPLLKLFLTRVKMLLLRSPFYRWLLKYGEIRLQGVGEVRELEGASEWHNCLKHSVVHQPMDVLESEKGSKLWTYSLMTLNLVVVWCHQVKFQFKSLPLHLFQEIL